MSKYGTLFLKPSDNYACTPSVSYTPRVCNSRRVDGCSLSSSSLYVSSSSSFYKTGIEVGKVVRNANITVGTTIVELTDEFTIKLSALPLNTILGQSLYIEHPSYPDAPQRPNTESDDGPMENLLTQDTGAPWVVEGPTDLSTVTVDIDLRRNCNLGTLGLLGVTKSGMYPSLQCVYYRTSAQGYDGDGTWAGLSPYGTPSFGSGNNVGWTTAGQTLTVAARYVRLVFDYSDFSYATRWSVGKLLAGGLITILSYLYGPNTKRKRVPSRLDVTTPGGKRFVTQYGATRRAWSLTFPQLGYADMSRFDAMGDTLYPYLWLDGMEGAWYEVWPTAAAEVTHRFGVTDDQTLSSDLYSVTLELVSV